MPKLEPKTIQKELDQGLLWPVYWLYGSEKMKSRELLKRIRKAVVGDAAPGAGSLLGLAEETLEGADCPPEAIVEAAQSLSLGGGLRLIIVRDAHAIKEAEKLAPLLGTTGKAGRKEDLSAVCVFLSKDLDGRKKFSKLLTEKAAVVACEPVSEDEREAWIQYLAKRRGLELAPELLVRLASLDPWSLDAIDQELEKVSLAGDLAGEVVLGGGSGSSGGADAFLQAFFTRRLKEALQGVESFAERPDESLPLLGLFAWNVRHLALVLADRENGTKTAKLNPYVADRFRQWGSFWGLQEVLELQQELARLDFQLKQTPLLPLGMWSSLVTRFCR